MVGRSVAAAAVVGLFAAAGCVTWRDTTAVGEAVQGAVARFVRHARNTGGRVGVVVVDAADGTVLAEVAAADGFAPASNAKLLTAAAALLDLGPDHRLRTELHCTGEVADGVLDGDLILRGFGDPTLGAVAVDANLDGLVAAVRSMGVRRVTGCVIGDGSWLGAELLGRGWQWDYLHEPYAAPFGGLCCHGNVATLSVGPTVAGKVVVTIVPEGVAAIVAVEQLAAGSPTRVSAQRRLGSDVIELEGSIAADAEPQTHRVAVRDPALFAAASLRAALHRGGVAVDGEPRAAAIPDGPGLRRVHTHTSLPLADLLRTMLRDSDNLYAEQLWRTAARVAIGDGGSEAAEQHTKDVLARLGVDVAGMVLADGSGLSRRNLLRPAQLTALLVAMYRSPDRALWLDALPTAGENGTLQRRMTEGPARGRVRAKTGSIARVACLSGYVDRADAPPLVFSVLWNDFTCPADEVTAAIDAFVQDLAALSAR